MASAFPGMDPFLEHEYYFPDLHGSLPVVIMASLQAALPEHYFANLNERVWPEPPGDDRHETFVEIRRISRDKGKEWLVTDIEVLSHGNKTQGNQARYLFLAKQKANLDGDINLVEIDLLRAGLHASAVSLGKLREVVGQCDYHVCVHPAKQGTDLHIYPVQLEDRLPEIAVPLLPGDGTVALDLQAVFNRCYDTGPYRRRVNTRLAVSSRRCPPTRHAGSSSGSRRRGWPGR